MEKKESSLNQGQKPPFSDEKVVVTSFKVDIIDIFLNAFTALFTGSVVMLAETFQGISDLIVDTLIYIGMKRSKRLPNEKHPFGYGRELYIWSLFSTLVMFLLLAGISFYFGLQRLIYPEPISHIFLAYIVLSISVLTNSYSFSLGARRILSGKPFWKIRKAFSDSTFLETKLTFTLDIMGVLAALFGLISLILFQYTGYLWFDGLGAIIIGMLMAAFSVLLLRNIRDFIIGVSVSKETKEEIKKTALEFEEVEEVLDLKAIVIGSNRLLVNLEIHVRNDLMTEEIEKLIDKIKANIKEKVPSVHHIQVELETPAEELQ